MGVLKDFDCSKLTKEQAVDGSSDYNIIRSGLSYCGFCASPGCRALRKLVVCHRGGGSHLVNDDLISGVVRCPICNKPFEMQFIALFQCKAEAVLHTHVEERTELVATGNEVVKLGMRTNGRMSEQALLTINIKKEKSCVVA